MKKVIHIIWCIWCAITTFISPIWITMIYLNVTGMIYKYDYSMDEGTAIIIGIGLLVLWLIVVLFPISILIRHVFIQNKRN